MPRALRWSLPDIVDFETLLHRDENLAAEQVRARDAVLVEHTVGEDRPLMLRRWLEARRRTDDPGLGTRLRESWHLLLVVAALVGCLIGGVVTAGALHYRGTEPVNVGWFFALTVLSQWLILALAALAWLLRRTALLDGFAPLLGLLRWLLEVLARRLPGEQRSELHYQLARLAHRREIYGGLAAWPLVLVAQVFGVCFNVGILATLLAHVAATDLAFGWQSTLHAGPAEVHRLVELVSAPWSALPEARPTLEQVAASQFRYVEGLRAGEQSAMRAWWPFLAYSVACYGLAVRLLLLALAAWRFRSALGALRFDHAECLALQRRLTGPLVRAQTGVDGLHLPADSDGAAKLPPAARCFALLASELPLEADAVSAQLRKQFGWELCGRAQVQIDDRHGSASALATLAMHEAVVVLVPAWRAPIRAIALFLREVKSSGAPVVVLLVGKDAPVESEALDHWRKFNAIHGLHLSLECWTP